jgi:hypothetical protein
MLPFNGAEAATVDPGDLRRKARPIRSIDPSDEDYSDLEPLADAIGDARVVQLGEPSLEARLHALGHPYMFLDLRGGVKLPSSVRTVRIPKFDSVVTSKPDRIYGGLVLST